MRDYGWWQLGSARDGTACLLKGCRSESVTGANRAGASRAGRRAGICAAQTMNTQQDGQNVEKITHGKGSQSARESFQGCSPCRLFFSLSGPLCK